MILEDKRQILIEAKNFKLKIGNRQILHDASWSIYEKDFIIVLGKSGDGKTTLLRLLAGLLSQQEGLTISGLILHKNGNSIVINDINEYENNYVHAIKGTAGIVFQYPILLDELSLEDNVNLAITQRIKILSSSRQSEKNELKKKLLTEHKKLIERKDKYIEELGLQEYKKSTRFLCRKKAITKMSGGQRQRASIIQTLSFNPDILFLDEPTSGLDFENSSKVADLLWEINKNPEYPKTIIIVTHDLTPFILSNQKCLSNLKILYLSNQQIRHVELPDQTKTEEIGKFLESLSSSPMKPIKLAPSIKEETDFPGKSTVYLLCHILWIFFAKLPIEAIYILTNFLRGFLIYTRWDFKYLWAYVKIICGFNGILYITIAGLLLGFLTTYFTVEYLPYRNILGPIFIDNIIKSLGFILYRVIIPIFVTLLLAARSGAAVCADIGIRRYHHQTDMLSTLDISLEKLLLGKILLCFSFFSCLLTLIAFLAAQITSLLAVLSLSEKYTYIFWDASFFVSFDNLFHICTIFKLPLDKHITWVLAKAAVCGLGVGVINYKIGLLKKESVLTISHHVTYGIFCGTLYVLIVHVLFLFIEF